MAELADALDSDSSRGNSVQVQVLLSASNSHNPNLFQCRDGFGFCILFKDWIYIIKPMELLLHRLLLLCFEYFNLETLRYQFFSEGNFRYHQFFPL